MQSRGINQNLSEKILSIDSQLEKTSKINKQNEGERKGTY